MPPSRRPSFRREARAYRMGHAPVAGCDEAGRGPWAGPVVAAAVILDPDCVPKGLNDSKMLEAGERERLFDEICACAEVAVAMAPPARIDRDNILRASLWALARAVCALPRTPRLVYVDGPHRPPLSDDYMVEPLIDGDAIVASISAASIVAKVTRDRLMCQLGLAYPNYGFERHKGYGTDLHGKALRQHGATPHHRASFAPVISVRATVTVKD
jgi:ribonuclease HII